MWHFLKRFISLKDFQANFQQGQFFENFVKIHKHCIRITPNDFTNKAFTNLRFVDYSFNKSMLFRRLQFQWKCAYDFWKFYSTLYFQRHILSFSRWLHVSCWCELSVFIKQLALQMIDNKTSIYLRGVFRTLWNIWEEVFCESS